MDTEAYRKTVERRLYDALFESQYDVWVSTLYAKHLPGHGYCYPEDAVAHFFVKKFGWTLEYCRTLKPRDIQTLLVDKVDFQKIPADLQEVFDEAFDAIELFSVHPKYKKRFLAESGKEKRALKKKP
jgi:hypothetical protein